MDYDYDKLEANFRRHGFDVTQVKTKEEALQFAQERLQDAHVVGFGGSITLDEIGVLAWLKTTDKRILDRYHPSLTQEGRDSVMRETFFADAYLMSANAVVETGALYNIDGTSNRVSALMFGPKKVYVFAGINKIVSNDSAAIQRVRTIAAPLNAKRLNRTTPCVKLGYCVDCLNADRICSVESFQRFCSIPKRIHLVLIHEELGY